MASIDDQVRHHLGPDSNIDRARHAEPPAYHRRNRVDRQRGDASGLEAITAVAWRHPPCSYASNYISDLGVPEMGEFQGRMINSPLHTVMNTAFVLHGVGFVIAAILLLHTIVRPGLRWSCLALALVHGIGFGLVGMFHGSQAAIDDGTGVLHGVGALLAIGGGNIAAIIVGIDLIARRGRMLGGMLITLGVLGIASFVYLLITSGTPIDGIPERIAVHTILTAELAAAVAILNAARRDTPPPGVT